MLIFWFSSKVEQTLKQHPVRSQMLKSKKSFLKSCLGGSFFLITFFKIVKSPPFHIIPYGLGVRALLLVPEVQSSNLGRNILHLSPTTTKQIISTEKVPFKSKKMNLFLILNILKCLNWVSSSHFHVREEARENGLQNVNYLTDHFNGKHPVC